MMSTLRIQIIIYLRIIVMKITYKIVIMKIDCYFIYYFTYKQQIFIKFIFKYNLKIIMNYN